MTTTSTAGIELATFGAGCFWRTERCFRRQFGTKLISAVVGYMIDSSLANSEEVRTSATNHVEVLQVFFDRQQVAYDDLVRFFFDMHDPTTLNRSGNHQSTQYNSAIFTHTEEQQKIAEQIRAETQANGKSKDK